MRLIRNKDEVSAEQALTHALELDRKSLKCLEERAELFIRQKKFEEASTDITRLLEISPMKKEAHYMSGVVQFNRKDYESAIKSFDLAIEQDSNAKYL